MITFADICAAAARIRGHVHRTPVLTSSTLDRELRAQLFCKCENLQKVGAFKARGAVNAVLSLDVDAAARGVVTHSSGNHAAALAYAAGLRRIPCTVVMPETAPAVKVAAVRHYGAAIEFCKPSERETVCERVVRQTGATLVHPFEDPAVIAGQGTAALELMQDVPELDLVIVPVGGGGLCAGTAIAVRGLRPHAQVLGAEPTAVDDAARSLATGVRQPRVEGAKSWADGLMTGLGAPNFEILRSTGVHIVTVDEQPMLDACRFVLERMKIVIEPSCATVVAALRKIRDEIAGKRIGVIFSGGNTDFRWLSATSGS